MTYNTEGIILRYRDIGEFDRIYSILTADHGKVEAWAQGVRKPQSKLVAHLQPLYLCDFMFARGRRFDRVAQVRIINRFPELWTDLEKMGQAIYAASLVDMVVRPGVRERRVWELMEVILTVISSDRPAQAGARNLTPSVEQGVESLDYARDDGIVVLFSLHLLKESGFSPEVHFCVLCKARVEGLSVSFDAIRGGVLCVDCFIKAGSTAFQVSSLTLETLEAILASPFSRLEMPETVRRELAIIADTMMEAHFGEEPKSRMFVNYFVKELPQMVGV